MTEQHVRVVRFGDSCVRIDCLGNGAVQLVDFLYGLLPSGEGPPPRVTLRVRAEPGDGEFTLDCDGHFYHKGGSLGTLASALLGQTMFHLSDRSRGGLLLHAAAVSSKNRCVLLPGTTGAGKTTLTAWLVRNGFEYLTDELVYIPLGTQDIHPFVRPLNIKTPSKGVLEANGLDFERLTPRVLSDSGVTLVPPSALGPVASPAEARLGIIVFPRHEASARAIVEPVSKAGAGKGLMECLINARNLPEHGFGEVTRLVKQVPACRLIYSDFFQVEEWVELLAESDLAGIPALPAVRPG